MPASDLSFVEALVTEYETVLRYEAQAVEAAPDEMRPYFVAQRQQALRRLGNEADSPRWRRLAAEAGVPQQDVRASIVRVFRHVIQKSSRFQRVHLADSLTNLVDEFPVRRLFASAFIKADDMSEPLQEKEIDALEQAAADVSTLLSGLGSDPLKCSQGVQTRAAYNDAWNHVVSVAKDTASQVLASAGPREVAAARTPPKPIEVQPSAISLAAKATFAGVPNKSELARLAIEGLANEYLERLEPLRSTLRNAVRDLANGDSGSLAVNLQRAAVAVSASGAGCIDIIAQGQCPEVYSELLEERRSADAYAYLSLHNLLAVQLWQTNSSAQFDRLTKIIDHPQTASFLRHVGDRLLRSLRRNLLPEFSARWQQPPDDLAEMWNKLIGERNGLSDNARLAITDWHEYECGSSGLPGKMPHLSPLDPMPEVIDARLQPCLEPESVAEVTPAVPSPNVLLADDIESLELVNSKAAQTANKVKGKNIDARMLKITADNPVSHGWTAKEWALHLDCAESTVKESKTWTEHLKAVRTLQKVEAAERMGRKGKRRKG